MKNKWPHYQLGAMMRNLKIEDDKGRWRGGEKNKLPRYLVGAMMMAYGPWSWSSSRVTFGSDWIHTSSGIRNAAVLPDPVSATPIISLQNI